MTESILKPGDVIEKRYEVESFLAAGGMQEVYVARDKFLPRKVALKTPKNDSASKRFKSSAELSARINHPHVAKTFDYFETADRAVLIEELLDGVNLEDYRSKSLSRFDPHLLAQFGHQVAKAVAASHHVGVVHRDLKPNNIIVTNKSGIFDFKVTDFGIAKLTEEELDRAHKSDSSITGSSTMLGALPYMSPEIIESPKAAGPPSDVWAVGAILFTLLAGDVPFGRGLKAIPKIMSGNLPSKPGICDLVLQYKPLCNEIWGILTSCMAADAKKRPTADELVNRFSELCFSPSPRQVGTIVKYRHAQNGDYGFLMSGGTEIFFHHDSYYGEHVTIGERVLFASHSGHPQNRAHPVVPMVESPKNAP